MSSRNHERPHQNSNPPIELLHSTSSHRCLSITMSTTTHRSDGPSTASRRRHWTSRRLSRKRLCLQSEILPLRASKNNQEQPLICIAGEHTHAPCFGGTDPFIPTRNPLPLRSHILFFTSINVAKRRCHRLWFSQSIQRLWTCTSSLIIWYFGLLSYGLRRRDIIVLRVLPNFLSCSFPSRTLVTSRLPQP
jgi:hypothetical protein